MRVCRGPGLQSTGRAGVENVKWAKRNNSGDSRWPWAGRALPKLNRRPLRQGTGLKPEV